MVKLIHELTLLQRKKILLAGDLMLDRYTFGKASRISPEAPVPILLAKEEKSLPGGAGNVALSLLELNQEVLLLGRIGRDASGDHLKEVLEKAGLDTKHVYTDESFLTPVKNRLIADRQQMLRIDHERVTPLHEDVEVQVIAALKDILKDVSLVALSDYGKGFLTKTLIQALIKEATSQGIHVIVDPKGVDFSKYRGAYIVKPNLKEAYAAANQPLDVDLNEVALKLLSENGIEKLLITRSEAGISLFDKTSRIDFPVTVKEVVDVTGAGDTVLAMLAASIASNLPLDKAASLCNVAASLALEHVGCCQISLKEISYRLLDQYAEDKFIDSCNAPALAYALEGRPHTIFELADETFLDPLLYEKIRALKVTSSHTVVVSLDVMKTTLSFAEMLASLKEVDFILKK